MNASTNSSSGVASGASPPLAATSSSAEIVSRAEPPPWRSTACTAASVTSMPGVGGQPADVLLEHVHRQQMELQVLRAAADGVADLLRIGGGQHEHDVRRWLLQRLQQRRLGGLGEHVHLVEDVHLVPAGGAERGLLDEVAHRIDAVVAGRVELVHVVAGAALDGQARLALAARLAVDRPLAVEHLGEDARRRGLAGATRAGEQVGLPLALVDDRIAQGAHDMLLAAHLAETARAIAAVERLCSHRCRAYSGGATLGSLDGYLGSGRSVEVRVGGGVGRSRPSSSVEPPA